MWHTILYNNPQQDILTRLLTVRGVADHWQDFLYPQADKFWIDPSKLHDCEKGIQRIHDAISRKEKIVVFGDYDVDGVTSSRIMYQTIRHFLRYPHITIRLPNRLTDGYGIKTHHIDEASQRWASLIITVDNGITAFEECLYAHKLGIDVVVTDHHQSLGTLPQAHALINPQISPDYDFSEICGAMVAFKVWYHLLKSYTSDTSIHKLYLQKMIPMVTIGTVADCMPLTHENRLIVKMWLDYLNQGIWPTPLLNFIRHIWISQTLDTFHIWYLIAPRLNAGGRMISPYHSLQVLMSSGSQQYDHFQHLEELNTLRKQSQESMFKEAEQHIQHQEHILIAYADSQQFHEGIIWIVAGRLTEKYHKPSLVLSCNPQQWLAVWSLRWPHYFSIIDMLASVSHLCERMGWHTQAWGLTIQIDKIDQLCQQLYTYCKQHIQQDQLIKHTKIDTVLYPHECTVYNSNLISKLAPFGEGNPEPSLYLPSVRILKKEKIWSKGNWHLKLHTQYGDQKLAMMFWGKGHLIQECDQPSYDIIWTLKEDMYNGGVYIVGSDYMSDWTLVG
jgi:single-stranded-DNA-specific exonuclease